MTHSLIKDLSILTTIPVSKLQNLVEKCSYIICDSIDETNLSEEKDILEIDIGIGTLKLSIEGESVAYRFIPSRSLSSSVTSLLVDHVNPLEKAAEKKITDSILTAYKDFF